MPKRSIIGERIRRTTKAGVKPKRIVDREPNFEDLRGILKDTYRKLGGAEAFHSEEAGSIHAEPLVRRRFVD